MRSFMLLTCLSLTNIVLADGPKDNVADNVRPIPPVGIDVDAATINALTLQCKEVRKTWQDMIASTEAAKPKQKHLLVEHHDRLARLRSLAPEILVFPRAVEMAIELNQFHKPKESEYAGQLLEQAFKRIEIAQREGTTWMDIVGIGEGLSQQLIVGGYQSKIDGSYQPYSVVVPAGFSAADARPRRLDLWFHGRGETLSEVAFLHKQQHSPGQYTPADTFVLHPYGRYSNAFKFAGEVDVLESLDYVQQRLPVNEDLVSVRGFSMGGAGCWQMAVHYADHFFAANPGAGFSETPQFLSFFQGENAADTASDYQKTLWQMYDCPPWAANLNQCPTVVYSGEIDRQKQAADVMEVALADAGIEMTHIIGPDTAHKIHPDSKLEVASRMASLARTASAATPTNVRFTTMTLRYHQMHWVDVQGLTKHWTPATVDASIDDDEITVETANVTRLRLHFDAGQWPGNTSGPIHVAIDGDEVVGSNARSDRSWAVDLARNDGQWQVAEPTDSLRKRPGLQGPIDDAFLDSFVFVLPSGTSDDEVVERWVASESKHAMDHWRNHFRGDVRQVMDIDLTEELIASSNLILFGDATSNRVIAEIASELPIKWNAKEISIGGNAVAATGHVPIMIYPNPKNPARYIVINSGFTFREYDYLNNARQTSKIPDWALVDIRNGATTRDPGIIKAAGFFNEAWQSR